MSSPARTGDPHLELSNNLAERCVKPFVVARKVFQKSGSEAGVRHTVRLFSIIRKAVINGLDPYRYLEYALENVGKSRSRPSSRIRRTSNPAMSEISGSAICWDFLSARPYCVVLRQT